MGVVTDFARRLLAPRDWFYSQLHRKIVKQHFASHHLVTDKEVIREFDYHDHKTSYRSILEPDPEVKKAGR